MVADDASVGVKGREEEACDSVDTGSAVSTEATEKKATSKSGWPLSDDTMCKAIDALFESNNRRQSSQSKPGHSENADGAGENVPLLEDPTGQDLSFFLQFTFKLPPKRNLLRPISIALQHSLHREGEEDVLFIVKDPQRLVKDFLKRKGDGGVTRVLGISKIRKRYKTYEGKRELLRQFDHFLVDHRVAPMLPRLLGKSFIDSKRIPRSVNMKRDVVSNIKRALHSTSFTPRRGTSTTIRVGHGDLSSQQIAENCQCVLRVVIKYIGGWKSVQAIHMKTGKSPALPVYLALPDTSRMIIKKGNGQAPSKPRVLEDDIDALLSGDDVDHESKTS